MRQDALGRGPAAPVPTGRELLSVGTANQTKLLGGPAEGPLFEFAPAIDEYLKTHLFGDIFTRDNLEWHSVAGRRQRSAHARRWTDNWSTPRSASKVATNAMKGIALRSSFDCSGRRWRHAAWLGLAAALAIGSVGSLAADDLRHKQGATAPQEKTRMWMIIGGTHRFAVTLENNPTARAFAQMLPMTLDMPDLNGNEKHVQLPRSLPANAVRPGTIRTGDVMLYGSDTLVVFYKTFPSSYSYTQMGSVTQVDGLVQALGTGSQRIVFALD